MFVVDGELLVNELAPRPHNSGHWTLDAEHDEPVRAADPGGLRRRAGSHHDDRTVASRWSTCSASCGRTGRPTWERRARRAAGQAPPVRQVAGPAGPQDGPSHGHVARWRPRRSNGRSNSADAAPADPRQRCRRHEPAGRSNAGPRRCRVVRSASPAGTCGRSITPPMSRSSASHTRLHHPRVVGDVGGEMQGAADHQPIGECLDDLGVDECAGGAGGPWATGRGSRSGRRRAMTVPPGRGTPAHRRGRRGRW